MAQTAQPLMRPVGTTSTEPIYPLRLQKFLARGGAASRRGSEELMRSGRVTVNGQVVTEMGAKVDPRSDQVCVDGRPVLLDDAPVYLMLNKPVGYLTTMDDPQQRPIVADLVPAALHPGLFPVGRLDLDTTGLLLFMTDGELAHRLLHPSRHVAKSYRAEVDGQLTEADAGVLREGVMLEDGPTKPAEVRVIARQGRLTEQGAHLKQLKKLNSHERLARAAGALPIVTTTVELVISEGRKRQVKRMLAAVGHPVLSLRRFAFGALELANLEPGSYRYLTGEELASLRQAVGL